MQLKTKQFWASGLVMMLFGITMVVVGTINNFLVVEFGVDKLYHRHYAGFFRRR
jgi:hypothetical protein